MGGTRPPGALVKQDAFPTPHASDSRKRAKDLAFGYALTSCPECPIHLRSRQRKRTKVERDPGARC